MNRNNDDIAERRFDGRRLFKIHKNGLYTRS
jgi:hypothetical protein